MDDTRNLTDISHRAYEHPAMRGAIAAVRRGRGAVPQLVDAAGARHLRGVYLASSLKVGPGQLPELWRHWVACCARLDVGQPPELFVSRDPAGHRGAMGGVEPFVVLGADEVKLFDGHPGPTRFLLGRELGHILSGHAVYNSALGLLLRGRSAATTVPVLGLAVHLGIALLCDWKAAAELSADRAGLLCAQDLDAALRYFMTMAGGEWSDADEGAFLAQEEAFLKTRSPLDAVAKLVSTSADEPRYVLRYHELKRWAEGGDYEAILAGRYPRRSEDKDASLRSEAAVSFSHLRERLGDTARSAASHLRRPERKEALS